LIDHGRTGLIVPPGNVEALSSAILRLLEDEPYAQQLGLAARYRYEQSYTPHHMTKKLQRVFLDLAA